MKNILFCFISVLLLNACSIDEDPGVELEANSGKLLSLKVDYLTGAFESGLEQTVEGPKSESDSIPIKVNYVLPGDFGKLELRHKPSNKIIFDGSIIWMGKGAITHPQMFKAAENFNSVATELPQPSDSRFQVIFHDLHNHPIPYDKLWKAVNKLEVVTSYLASGKKIGVFLYTPSVGVGNPADWDWFLVMEK